MNGLTKQRIRKGGKNIRFKIALAISAPIAWWMVLVLG
jgi:hypothetical protein